MRAKQDYLADTGVEFDGVFEKSLLVSALFGLPMLRVEMPGTPSTETVLPPLVTGTQPVPGAPGAALGLQFADVTIAPVIIESQRILSDVTNVANSLTATLLTGESGTVARPGHPVLPLAILNVDAPGGLANGVLRGVGFRGGVFVDTPDVMPLTRVPATELGGVRPVFRSTTFYPSRPWTVNYFDNLIDPANGVTRLMLTPAQFKSNGPDSITGILRKFTTMDFRFYYSSDRSEAALAAPPSIANVEATSDGAGNVLFRIHVSDPLVGVQEVWVTHTAVDGSTCLADVWI